MISSGYQEAIYHQGDSYFHDILHDIQQATQSIDIEMYTFKLDSLGKRVLHALQHAQARGVTIRILVDGVGTPFWGGKIINQLEKKGGETKVFHPFPWQWHRAASQMAWTSRILALFLNINSRTHRKVIIIDQMITYIGSFNIDQCHVGSPQQTPWRDTGVRLRSADITELMHTFENCWSSTSLKHHWHHFTKPISLHPIRLNHGRHRRRFLYKTLLRRLAKCQKRIWITNAYFIPDTCLLKILQQASNRGVDVRILLPRYSDVPLVSWASEAFYDQLMQAGVRIFEYLPSMLHAKTILLDDQAYVGTSNMNHRSLLHDLEVDVELQDPANNQCLMAHFEHDLTQARECVSNSSRRPRYQRYIGRVILFLRYLL